MNEDDLFLIPLNEDVDQKVRDFVQDVIDASSRIAPDISVDVDYDEALNTDGTQKSSVAYLDTKMGHVMVAPNFRTNSATAFIVNRGLVEAMILEGFEEAEIENASIYSNSIDYNDAGISVISIFLTKDLGVQHQKHPTSI